MDRTSISRRIGSIKGDIEKLSNTLCAIEKTDIRCSIWCALKIQTRGIALRRSRAMN